MSYALAFEPLAPWWAIALAAGLALAFLLLGAVQRARGVWARAAATALLLATLLNPVAVETERERIRDVAVIVTDTSESQSIGERGVQAAAAIARLKEDLQGDATLELRVVDSGKATAEGTTLIDAARRALADTPPDRVAGIVFVTDGEVHDAAAASGLPPAPVHTLLTGTRATIQPRRAAAPASPCASTARPPPRSTRRSARSSALPSRCPMPART